MQDVSSVVGGDGIVARRRSVSICTSGGVPRRSRGSKPGGTLAVDFLHDRCNSWPL